MHKYLLKVCYTVSYTMWSVAIETAQSIHYIMGLRECMIAEYRLYCAVKLLDCAEIILQLSVSNFLLV